MLSIFHSIEGELKDVLTQVNAWKKEYHKVKVLKIIYQDFKDEYIFIVEIKGASISQKDKITLLYNTEYANS